MVTREEAMQIAQNRLASKEDKEYDLVVVTQHIIEKPYAWVVPWTSKQWFETGDIRYAIAGNSPFIISKLTGEITSYSSAYDIRAVAELYEEEYKLYGLKITSDLSSASTKLALKRRLQLSNPEIMHLTKSPDAWAARGGRKRLESISRQLQAQGVQSEVHLCL